MEAEGRLADFDRRIHPRQSEGCFVSLIGDLPIQVATRGTALNPGGFFSFIGEFAPTVGQLPTICISAGK